MRLILTVLLLMYYVTQSCGRKDVYRLLFSLCPSVILYFPFRKLPLYMEDSDVFLIFCSLGIDVFAEGPS